MATETLVRIIAVEQQAGVTTTELQLDEGSWLAEPLAPATVWRGENPAETVLELLRLVSRDAPTARFESSNVAANLTTCGEQLRFYAWWTPEQLHAAKTPPQHWTKRTYTGRDHDHCRLTWKAIREGQIAYRSEAGWITCEAYRRFIEADELRLRSVG